MEEAERIAREEHGSVKLAIISGAVSRYPSFLSPVSSIKGYDELTHVVVQVLVHATTTESWGTNWMGHT